MGAERDALERGLARAGQPVVFRRRIGTGTTFVELQARAVVRDLSSEEMIGALAQVTSRVIVSPSVFETAPGWPGAAGGDVYPRKGDLVVHLGLPRAVEFTKPIQIGAAIVRLEVMLKG